MSLVATIVTEWVEPVATTISMVVGTVVMLQTAIKKNARSRIRTTFGLLEPKSSPFWLAER